MMVYPLEVSTLQIGILSPELKSIQDLFAGDARFLVPRYQRNFAWTADETEELWEDVFGAVDRSGEYFLGTVVLHRADSETGIIDGQQRLASIAMLFSAIRNVFLSQKDNRANEIEMRFLGARGFERDAALTPKLALNKTNNETFLQYVLASQDQSMIDQQLKDKGLHPSNRLLLEAYKFFLGKIANEVSARGTKADKFLVDLLETLSKKLRIIAIPVISNEDANLFFESLNARGKELAISDLVKNRLYHEAASKVTRVEQLWEHMEKDLTTRTSVPEYIRHFWIAKKTAKDGPNVREKHLYRLIANDIKGKQNEAIKLATDLSKSASDYARISDHSLWPDDSAYDDLFSESISDLRLFRVTQMNPLLLNAIQQFSKASEIAKAFRIVANFAFRYFIVGNQSPGNLEKLSARIAYEIRAKVYTSPKDVADALRAVNTDPTFRSDFTLTSMEGKRIARYTLSRISNYLARQASASGGEQITNPDAKQVNLEHVFPQDKPAAWTSAFSNGVDPADYVYRLGNLTLLRVKPNRTAADKSFTEKKRIAFNGSTLKINEFFKGISKWSEREIEQRQDGLAKAAVEVWKL
jgi:uncharacterized protein with ParB-like and HNH nuclease domain